MFIRAALLHCLTVTLCNAASPVMQRIVGGTSTSIERIPYQVALYVKNHFTCGGSLITKSCVLTAGHCVIGRAPYILKIRAGTTFLNSVFGEIRSVSHTYTPEKFKLSTLDMDVAILRLTSPLGGTNIATIELSEKQVNAGDELLVSGWGFTNENASAVSKQLQVVAVQAISREQCSKQYPTDLTDSMFCAGATGGGKDACAGDSGGPAVMDGRQMGIVSWGNGCARANFYGVYTSIRHVLPWINRIKHMHCAFN